VEIYMFSWQISKRLKSGRSRCSWESWGKTSESKKSEDIWTQR
jgi:hypothetical protein